MHSLHFNIISFFSFFIISNIEERWCSEVLKLTVEEVSEDRAGCLVKVSDATSH